MKIKKITSKKIKTNKTNKTKNIKLSAKRDYDAYNNYVNKIINNDKTLWSFKIKVL